MDWIILALLGGLKLRRLGAIIWWWHCSMRTLILGDIHANLEAFNAVLEDVERRGGFERLWCLGDVVGYGPDPSACMALLRRHAHLCVVGNHDRAATGGLDIRDFNPYAALACRWTASRLTSEDAAWLSSLPEVVREGDFTLVHGSLRHPVWEYLLSDETARNTFELLDTLCCLVGHSHVPFLCREVAKVPRFEMLPEGVPLNLGDERWILNPGAVGQPRDGDPRASYVIYDETPRSLTFWRVEYDVSTTQEKMRRAGLPEPLADRLSFGR
jgi:diadenosine tetraphosphatase ApaH/serine/threonine PP2A family protein phosphatase